MKNLVITRSLKAIAAVFTVAAIAFAPMGARAAEQNIKFRGQDIWVDGAELKWIGSPTAGDAELLLIYKGSTGTFRTSANVEARVLAIGGGGAGGTVRKGDQTKHPGGGGGGAGELVDRNNVSLLAGDAYQLTIGAGGLPQGSDTDAQPGQNGEDSVIARGGTDFLRVKGGGGGGGEGVGQPGGSGGGGSNDGAVGGESVKINADGQGHAGGTSGKRYAAGGGGAGAAGGNGSTGTSGGSGGKGGDGVESDIDPDNVRFYAGGGGGGNTAGGSGGTGGSGGGGKGGTSVNSDSAVSTPGEANTGSGGGGGGRYKPGSAGGSGIIIIRLTFIDQPMVWKDVQIPAKGARKAGTIFVDKDATTTWVGDDLVIIYSNVNARGGLNFAAPTEEWRQKYPNLDPVWANARVLSVGGGGGGGFIDVRSYGAGAGGGAGGVVDTDGLVFDNTVEFSIQVGAGGKGGARNEEMGKNGNPSLLTIKGTTENVVDVALGGGGGGAHSDGAGSDSEKVGSGGGASRGVAQGTGGESRIGGKGSQGCDGGDASGSIGYIGAGGGGAGGKGESVTTSGQVAAGGAGVQKNITGKNEWYAAGGGGAYVNPTINSIWYLGGKGGSGIGGDGAGATGGGPKGQDAVPIPATSGVDGTGSGGGGGTCHIGCTLPAGDGGNGIVIIRLSNFVVDSVPVPGKLDPATGKYWGPTTNVYDGTWQVGVADFFAYTFKTSKTERTTWPVAVDADNYVVTVNIAPGAPYTWADWTPGMPEEKKWGDRTIYWRINRREVEVPEHTASFVYNATERIAVDKDKLHLDDAGYCYTDDELRLKYCQLTATHRATDAESYQFDAKLFTTTDANGQPVTNFVWSGGSIADENYHWRITQAPNAILNFTYDSYKLSRIDTPAKAHHPTKHFDASWGKDTAVIEYRVVSGEGQGEGEGWMAWPPTEKGSYELRVTVPECDNWAKATATLPFGTWEKLADLFSDQMPVTAAAAGAALENFPVPVRLHEPTKDGYSEMSGFTYLRAGLDGTAIQFFDSNEDPIPHEVELWNIRGESVVWVKLPKVTTSKTSFKMCWKRVTDADGRAIYLKPYDGGAVWRDNYSGVWHMSKLEEGRIPDATGNGRDAYFTGDAKWEFLEPPAIGKSVTADNARMGKAVYLKSGDLLVDDGYPYPEGTMSNRFSYSGWYRYPDFKDDKAITGGYKMFAGTKLGAASTGEMKSLAGWCLRMNNGSTKVVWGVTGDERERTTYDLKTTFGFLGCIGGFNTTRVGMKQINGADTYANNNDAGHKVTCSGKPLQLATGGFSVDEVRLSTNAFTDAWIKEEYNTLQKANYCENGLVSIDCDRYNDGKGLICDWWVTAPSLSKTMWKEGETLPTVSKGTYKSATTTAISYYCKDLKTGVTTTNALPTAVGYYRATFDHSAPANYRPQAHTIDFYIIKRVDPTKDLGGSESGRVLIMNADNRGEGPVTNQGWCATSEEGVTYWKRLDGEDAVAPLGVSSNNVLPGTKFDLVRRADGKVLWHLEECRQGNTFTTNNLLLKGQNYLPASVSATALSVTNENVKATTKGDAGWLMLRNVEGASVTSGVLTNGVGTIYFDAVNQKAVESANYKLVVEVATAATAAELENLDAIGEDRWKEKDMYALWFQNSTGTTSKDLDATKELALAETHGATAASESYFYRVHVPVLEHRPTRVRIRRTAFDNECDNPDEAMILMDNLIVSIPPTSAELQPYGKLNTSLKGVQVVGQGGAFVPPFPSAGAPAPKGRARVVLPPGCAYAGQSPDSYLSLAQMFYRRRYLGQLEGAGEWQVAIMEGAGAEAVETLEPLGVAMEPGDIEFRFTAVMKSPYYGYVDYSNKINTKDRVTQKGDWTEEKALKESEYESPDPDLRLASLGEDWFCRIRRAASDWERTEVELHGAIEGLYPMELMDDGTWRAVVRIPVDAEEGADCTFKFNGWNRQTPGATEYASNRLSWGGGGTVEELPNNGVLSEAGGPTTFKLDHRSGYLEFRIRIEGDSKIWSIARAEYQDFNSWNDAHTTEDIFHVNDVLTNGVDDVNMTSKTNDWSKYALFAASNDAWNETFYTADYSKDFPLDVVYDTAPKMPNGYYHGRYISFVHSKLAKKDDEAKAAGLAGKLLGQGKGTIDFLGTGTVSPDGIDTITFQARVGQSASFDGIGYDLAGMFGEGYLPRANYMFFAQSTMSEACDTGGATLGDMAVGASISLVGYYIPYQGCYEIRVERPYSGAEYTMKLCKWRNVNGVMTCETLASTRFYNPASYAWTDEASTKGDAVKGRFGFFISCETLADGSTQVAGGLSKAAKGPDTTYPARAYSGGNFNGLVVIDKDSNFTWGSYGVMSKDCPSQFLLPIVFHAPLQTLPTKTQIVANKSWYFSNQPVTLNGADDATKFDSCATGIKGGYQWALPTAKRLESYEAPGSADWIGLRAPTNLNQRAVVQIRKQGGGDADWTTVMETPVSSYAFVDKKLVLHRTGRWDVRYTTGAQAIDVVFTGIKQTRWHAADDANIDVHNEDFTFTQALMETNTVSRRRELVLQPARADASKPVSLRAPMMNGLGKLTFSYTHADADAQIWVQIATNNVSGSTLGGGTGYNQSIREGEGEGEWITVRKFGPYAAGCDEELGEKGVRTVYVGFHDDGTEEKPHKGVMRLWVPTEVVTRAVDLATNATKVTSHGQVTVTGVLATDEPRLSERSWRGWNMRTAGDAADSERRMYLSDATLANDLGYGLVGALNNTADPATIVETDDGTKAKSCLPTIFSPTFGAEGGTRTGIGAVSFKARVYERPGETAPPGRITVWGASDNTGANWTLIGTNEVVSTVFTNFTWATGGSYSAIKFELSSPGYRKGVIDTGRVILDEILISEKVQPSVTFDYARPFRMNLATHSAILDIMSPDEQPLAGESWGVQTKLTLKQLEKEVDVEKGFKVYFSYYRGEEPWGYEQWKDRGDAVVRQELELVGDASNLVFRSNIEIPATLVPPAATGGQTVQFMLEAEYSTGAGKAESQMLTRGMWKQPEWYYPVDKNADHGGDRDETRFAAYSIIDTVSPGRAWINEVNWNDGLKSETGGTLSKTNQYVEVCVPAGVDMTGWYVQLTGVATDPAGGKKTGKLFTFGKWGVAKSKNTGRAVNGYEFMFVQSPDTADRGDGGVKDVFGNPADGTWSDGDQVGMTRGTLVYYLPYQFELYRPSGVLEHQFVLEGTNTASLLSGSMYSGTNLVAELNQIEIDRQGFASPKRFYAGEEKARRKSGALYGSAGVVGTGINGEAASSPLQYGPGSDGTWDTGLLFTPGTLNEGQTIPPGWFLPPNGTNSWIYASVVGDHLHQKVGDDTGRSILIIVPQGGRTNIHYTVDNFYELDSIAVNGVTNAAPRHVPHVCDYEISSPTGTLYVVATEGVDDRLLSNWGLGPKNPFTPSILNWLGANWPDKDVDDMVPAHYQMVDNNAAAKHELGLNDMYWLDIPPFTASGDPEWLLRAGVKGMQYPVVRNMHNRAYTNLILTVKMYVENDHTFETNRVVKMQGLDDSRSNDPTTYDVWNSQTFKIRGALDLNQKFLPFRTFIFDGGSFDANYTSKIEIMDPWSPASPGYSYGWDLHPEKKNSSFWCTTMDTDAQPVTIETLKSDSTY